MIRIAIIEDEPIDSDNVRRLVEGALGADVKQAFNRADAEALLSTEKFDLVIMDVELGSGLKNRFAGLGMLADIPATWPTIVVSGMPEENIMRGMSLELHAYDFISKPIDEADLINKIERALEWYRFNGNKATVNPDGLPDGLTPDPKRKNEYLWKGKQVRLTITQLRLLECLIEQPGQVVDNKRLQDNLKSGSAKAVVVHVSGMRTKFRAIDPKFDRIDNVPGRGYFWKTAP